MEITNIISYYDNIQLLQTDLMPGPRFVDLHTSNRCNQNCKGCAYANWLDNKIMSEEDHMKIIYDLLDLGVKGFDFAGGGEPLMLRYLPGIWDTIKRHGGNYGLVTNGTLLTDDLIDQLVEQATYVRISLEATCPHDYCMYKGVSTNHWSKAVGNIDKLVKAKKAKNSKCDISIKFSVGKSLRGFSHYHRGIQLGKVLKVDNVQFKALRHKPEELTLQEKKDEDLIDISAEGIQVRKWITPAEKIPQCWLNPLHTVVDHTGNVYICCYYYYRGKEHVLGNMLETKIDKFWFSDEHKKKIKDINKKECAKVDCKFFRHHRVVDEMIKTGKWNFL